MPPLNTHTTNVGLGLGPLPPGDIPLAEDTVTNLPPSLVCGYLILLNIGFVAFLLISCYRRRDQSQIEQPQPQPRRRHVEEYRDLDQEDAEWAVIEDQRRGLEPRYMDSQHRYEDVLIADARDEIMYRRMELEYLRREDGGEGRRYGTI